MHVTHLHVHPDMAYLLHTELSPNPVLHHCLMMVSNGVVITTYCQSGLLRHHDECTKCSSFVFNRRAPMAYFYAIAALTLGTLGQPEAYYLVRAGTFLCFLALPKSPAHIRRL